jgi:hypothetical protein
VKLGDLMLVEEPKIKASPDVEIVLWQLNLNDYVNRRTQNKKNRKEWEK